MPPRNWMREASADSHTRRRLSAIRNESKRKMNMNRLSVSGSFGVGQLRRAWGKETSFAAFWRQLPAVSHLIKRRAVLAVIAMVLALPTASATAPKAPTSDFEYDGPCDGDGSGPSYGGEAGARVGVLGIGCSACASNPTPCPSGVAGAVGNAYGHCSYVPTCYRVCIYVEVLGHKVQYCWESCD